MKTALIIDGNYLLFKDVFILHYMKSLYVDLETLLKKDIEKLLKMYPFDKIYFVSDSKSVSWRKFIYKEYKSKRSKDINVDWDWVFNKYDELKEELKYNNRINFLEFENTEGDDIIAYLTNEGNIKGYSNFIMASDSDIQQLLRYDIHNDYINVIYNFKHSDEKIYLPENHMIYMKEKSKGFMSMFDMNDDDEYLSFLNDIKKKCKIVEVDTNKLIFEKIISGDKKDTVPSVYIKNNRGIGKAGSETLYDNYKNISDTIDFDSDEFINNAINILKYNKNIIDDDVLNDIKNNIILNRKLKILKNIYLPDNILKEMKTTINL